MYDAPVVKWISCRASDSEVQVQILAGALNINI